MRVALCLSGLPRYIKESYALFSKNLVGFESMDIFIHSWKQQDTDPLGVHKDVVRLDSVEEIDQLYNITDSLFEPQRYDIAPENIEHDEFIHWSMFYSVWAANNLKRQHETKNNIKYDRVIRTRFDCALCKPLDVEEYPSDKVYTPSIHRGEVIEDWFNFSTSETMDKHAEVWKNMQKLKDLGISVTSGEELVTNHLKYTNTEFTSIEADVRLIRNNKVQVYPHTKAVIVQ